jgi:hypothetical protein
MWKCVLISSLALPIRAAALCWVPILTALTHRELIERIINDAEALIRGRLASLIKA